MCVCGVTDRIELLTRLHFLVMLSYIHPQYNPQIGKYFLVNIIDALYNLKT